MLHGDLCEQHLKLCMLDNFFMPLFSADFFKNKVFKKFFQEHYRSVKWFLDLDQDRCSVSPYLGPNCLQRLDDKNQRKELGCFSQLLMEKYISYFSTKTYVVGTQKNHLKERVYSKKTSKRDGILSIQNIFKING